jgi:hypothetical protein
MKIAVTKERFRDRFVGKLRFKKFAVGSHPSANANIKCLSKVDIILNDHFQPNPNDDFTIKAHHLSPTTSVSQVPAATAPSFSSLAVETTKQESKPKSKALKAFSCKTFKSKVHIPIKPFLRKAKSTPATNLPATASPSLCPSFPPPLTITVPEPLEDHQQVSLESPSDRVKRVASAALNNLGRAFSSCLPLLSSSLSPKISTPLDQNLETSSSPTTNEKESSAKTLKSRALSLKSKSKKFKDAFKKKKKKESGVQNIFSTSSSTTTTALDDMMERMIDRINSSTGRNNRYKRLKKLWKRTTKWIMV